MSSAKKARPSSDLSIPDATRLRFNLVKIRMRTEKKHQLAKRRHWRVRQKIQGTRQRPRMSVCFSQKNIHVQFIDDAAGVTLAAASSVSKSTPDREGLKANVNGAKRIGTLAAKVAQDKGITSVVFDRGAAPFHGKVKALADAAREAGLKF
jgi:large subunit ribosomal protein L18